MGSIIVANRVTLDGVMQGPGDAEEDTRDGFSHGGWATRYSDDTVGAKIGQIMAGGHSWLFGRWSYQDMLGAWNERGGPFKDALNSTPKYVASSDANAVLPWPNSTLLHCDVPAAVADLKAATDDNLVIMGSGVLIRSLLAVELIDKFLLMIAPLVLGTGRRLFTDGAQASLRLTDVTAASTGAVIATYEPVRATS